MNNNTMNKSIAGVIIMGGRGTRMGGQKKAFLEYKGEKFYKRIAKALANTSNIYLSVEDESFYNNIEFELIEDLYKNIGPLGGIYSALKKCSEDAILVLPSDTPLINELVVNKLINTFKECDKNVVLFDNGRVHPLIAIYKKECISVVEALIKAENYRVYSIFEHIDFEVVDFDALNIERCIIQDCNDKESYLNLVKENFKYE